MPFPAGGPTDALARILAERMRGPLGQPVIIENPTGAGGTIGTGRVARAGDLLAISIPRTETAVIRHFKERMPYGSFVQDMNAI